MLNDGKLHAVIAVDTAVAVELGELTDTVEVAAMVELSCLRDRNTFNVTFGNATVAIEEEVLKSTE